MSGTILGSQIPRHLPKMKESNIQTNLWMNPYISPKGELYDRIKPYTSSHTVWCGIVPDYMMSEAQRILIDHLRNTN